MPLSDTKRRKLVKVINASHKSALDVIMMQRQLEEIHRTRAAKARGRAGARGRLRTGGILGGEEGRQLILDKEARAREPGRRRMKWEETAAAATALMGDQAAEVIQGSQETVAES